MGQYLLSVHHREGDEFPAGEELQATFAAVDAFNEELRAGGAWVFAGGLAPVDTATVVDGRGPAPIVTDGPFAETKEYLGGFWIIEAADLDDALSWAGRGSKACALPVEVRPFQPEPDA